MQAFERFLTAARPLFAPMARAGSAGACLWPVVLVAAALGAGRAHAATAVEGLSEQGQAALQHLLHSQAGGGAARADGAAHAEAAGTRARVVLQRGETLDRVIARTLRDSPFRVEVLREAYMRLNRSAFPRGTPQSLVAGSTLVVPTPADVLGIVDPQRQWSAPPASAHAPAASPARAATPALDTDRRNWIRYP
jgi:Tfp pilus assembly protein FimV